MKLTFLEAEDIIFSLIKDSALMSIVHGKLYKDARPLNSIDEDVVVTTIASDANELQEFRVNVNIFVPDIRRGQEYIKDRERLQEISSACLSLFEHGVFGQSYYKLDSQTVFSVNNADAHCVNNSITLRYYTNNN